MFTCYNNRPHNETLSRRNTKKFRHIIYSLCPDPNVIILKTRFHRTVRFSSGQFGTVMVPWRGRAVQPGLSCRLHKKQPAVCCGYMTGDVTVLKYLEWGEPADPPCPDRGRPPSLRRPDHFISPLTLPSLLSALHIDLPTHFPPAGIFAPLGGQSSPRQSNDQPHTRTQRRPLDWQPNYPAWERASRSAVPQLTGSEGRLSSSPSRSTPLCIFLPVSAVCVYVCVCSA